MALLIFALVAIFVISAVLLVEVGLFPWLSVLIAIPISYVFGFALSRVLRSAGRSERPGSRRRSGWSDRCDIRP